MRNNAASPWRAATRVTFAPLAYDAPQTSVLVYPAFDLGDQQKTRAANPMASAYIPGDEKVFSAKRGQTLSLYSHGRSILLLGMGAPDTLDATACEETGAALHKALAAQSLPHADIIPRISPEMLKTIPLATTEAIAAHIASGALLKGYSFNKYKTMDKSPVALELTFRCSKPNLAESLFAPLSAVADGVWLARDLANEPPNVAFPLAVAQEATDALAENGNVRVKTFTLPDLKEMGAGGIIAVGQGSRRSPCMVVMEYDGTNGRSKYPDLALVGKGVTFDTGGISIKPAANMQDMKYDMCGAADVVGTMLALSRRKANTHVVGVIGLAENMPDGNAYRPGDILRLMSGKSVEITNTDAEGRLVLSDCLTYVEKTFKPKAIIDLATLTGACVAALGHSFAAVLTRDEKLQKRLVKTGAAVNEPCWPLPLHDAFTQAVRGSKFADLNNSVPGPGTSTAGAFLEQAILKKTPWAHLDIAGMAWAAPGPLTPDDGSASGFGVRLLDRLVRDYYEHKSPAAPVPQGPAPYAK